MFVFSAWVDDYLKTKKKITSLNIANLKGHLLEQPWKLLMACCYWLACKKTTLLFSLFLFIKSLLRWEFAFVFLYFRQVARSGNCQYYGHNVFVSVESLRRSTVIAHYVDFFRVNFQLKEVVLRKHLQSHKLIFFRWEPNLLSRVILRMQIHAWIT